MNLREVLKQERFTYYPKCQVCKYYKHYFGRLVKIIDYLNDETINYDWDTYLDYKQHIKKHHSKNREVTLLGKI